MLRRILGAVLALTIALVGVTQVNMEQYGKELVVKATQAPRNLQLSTIYSHIRLVSNSYTLLTY